MNVIHVLKELLKIVGEQIEEIVKVLMEKETIEREEFLFIVNPEKAEKEKAEGIVKKEAKEAEKKIADAEKEANNSENKDNENISEIIDKINISEDNK